MELNFLINESIAGEWFKPANSDVKMTFEEYKSSNLSAETLALVFHSHYERSSDTQELLNERMANARKWFEFFETYG